MGRSALAKPAASARRSSRRPRRIDEPHAQGSRFARAADAAPLPRPAPAEKRSGYEWILWAAIGAGLAAGAAGCDGQPAATPTSRPATAAGAPAPVAPQLNAERQTWTRAQAAERLSNPESQLSAALRLAELGAPDAACISVEMSGAWLARLRVIALGDAGFALGIGGDRDSRRLGAPLLFGADGTATRFALGAEEETAQLVVSQSPESFPHLVITPDRVIVVGDPPRTALAGAELPGVAFDVRRRRGVPMVVLGSSIRAPAPQSPASRPVFAEYVWDALEEVFRGPVADALPNPPGGRYELDVDLSSMLLPVGGEVPEPRESPTTVPAPERPRLPY